MRWASTSKPSFVSTQCMPFGASGETTLKAVNMSTKEAQILLK